MASVLSFLKMTDLYLLGKAAPPQIEGDVVRRPWNPTESAREKEITDLVEGTAGGSIRVEFSEDNRPGYAYIVEVPKERQDLLIELPGVGIVYTGQIPRSTVRKYDPQLKLAAKIWDAFRKVYASQPQSVRPTASDS